MATRKSIDRRRFLRFSAFGTAGLVLAACGSSGSATPAAAPTAASSGAAGGGLPAKDVAATLTTFNWGNPDEAKAYAAAFAASIKTIPTSR